MHAPTLMNDPAPDPELDDELALAALREELAEYDPVHAVEAAAPRVRVDVSAAIHEDVETTADLEPPAPTTPRWLELGVRGLDDALRTPDGRFGVGLDPILGMLAPGVGDMLGAFVGLSVLVLALRQGVPTVVLGKMVLNILADGVLGVVPGAGDLFDLFFRSNRRNLELLEEYRDPGAEPTLTDKLLVGAAVLLALGLAAVPFVVLYLFGSALAGLIG